MLINHIGISGGKDSTATYNQKWYAMLRWEVLSRYGGSPPCCDCCGETHIEFLGIDHINGGGRKHRAELRASYGNNILQWLKTNGFPSGFRVLCHNCNQAIGHFGSCPHESERRGEISAVASLSIRRPIRNRVRAIAVLRESPTPLSVRQIAEAVGMNWRAVRSLIYKARMRGEVMNVKKGLWRCL